MGEYSIDMRDVRFVLYEHLKIQELAKLPHFKELEHDKEIYDIVLDEAYKMAREQLSSINEVCDREGARWNPETSEVKMAPGFQKVYDVFRQNNWVVPAGDPNYGGGGLPEVLGAAVGEMFAGANCAFMITSGLTAGAAALVNDYGSDELKETYLEKMLTGEWAGTMCLTEAGAGSDVGASRAKAIAKDGYYTIEGTKIFISSGDQDITDNIVHLVLARTEGAPVGVKGLSLFLVPKFRLTADGKPGETNGVRCSGIEEKLGIHGSPTCTMEFGTDGEECHGWLIGEECQGIKIMFHMMNEARLFVGVQSIGISNLAYREALAFSKERIQFSHFSQMANNEAPKVPIVKHPDVRRMLMFCKSYSEAMRALIFETAMNADLSRHAEDEATRKKAFHRLELLTPICKAWSSDMAFRVTETALQCYGGYGYCSEYPAEQLMRDVKIASIYEGTNGIQALDLLGRKVAGKMGLRFMELLQDMNAWVAENKENEDLGDLVLAVDDAKNKLSEVTFGFQMLVKKNPALMLTNATPYLQMFGDIMGAYLLTQQAILANEKAKEMIAAKGLEDRKAIRAEAAENPELGFYWNKVQTAKHFVHRILPGIDGILKVLKGKDMSTMDVVL